MPNPTRIPLWVETLPENPRPEIEQTLTRQLTRKHFESLHRLLPSSSPSVGRLPDAHCHLMQLPRRATAQQQRRPRGVAIYPEIGGPIRVASFGDGERPPPPYTDYASHDRPTPTAYRGRKNGRRTAGGDKMGFMVNS
jgi:hypothetical protein